MDCRSLGEYSDPVKNILGPRFADLSLSNDHVLPRSLYDQLEPRGRLAIPVGRRRVQRLELVIRSPEGPAIVESVPCRFVPLLGEEGFGG